MGGSTPRLDDLDHLARGLGLEHTLCEPGDREQPRDLGQGLDVRSGIPGFRQHHQDNMHGLLVQRLVVDALPGCSQSQDQTVDVLDLAMGESQPMSDARGHLRFALEKRLKGRVPVRDPPGVHHELDHLLEKLLLVLAQQPNFHQGRGNLFG